MQLTPVDHDPFAESAPATSSADTSLTPVDYDPFAEPEKSSGLTHALARTGRDIVGGVSGIGDIGYAAVAPIYQAERKYVGEPIAKALGLQDYMGAPQDTSKMQPSVAAKAAYDVATNNAGVPQSNTEAAVDKATEFLTAAASGAPLSNAVTQGAAASVPTATSLLGKTAESLFAPISASEALAMGAPKTIGQAASVAGAGAGSEIAHQIDPESNVAPLVGSLAGSMITPGSASLASGVKESLSPVVSNAVKPIAQKALEYGIPLTRSQIGDSRFNQSLASVAEKMPLSGGVQFRENQQTAFNRAVASTFGENADKVTPEVIDSAYKKIGAKFDQVHNGLEVKVNDDILNQLSAIEDDAKHSVTGDHFKIVQNNINKFLNDIDENGVVPGEKLNSLRSNLAKTLKSTRNDASPYLGEIHDLVMDAATGKNPQAQQLLNEARYQYKNLKTIEPLAAKNAAGDISPALLTNRVRQSYRDFPRGGGGKLGDLARIGNAFLKEKIPNSGTPERQLAYKIAGGAGAALTGALNPSAALVGAGALGAARGFNALNQSQRSVQAGLAASPIVNRQNYTPGLMSALLKQ